MHISRSIVFVVWGLTASTLVVPHLAGAAPSRASAARAASAALPSLAPLVDSVKGAVVGIDVQARPGGGNRPGAPAQPFFSPFGQPPIRQGQGSGFIIGKSGLVLTNNHVVEGAVSIRVSLDDGRSFTAKIVGRDPLTDIALLQLEGKAVGELPVLELGDSDAIRPGDWVMAIGNPFGLTSSVSLGIVSAKARNIHAGPYDDFLQTDAAINPGNSGGPLFNLEGKVVGINTAIVGGGTGIGFAVPSNLVKALVPMLREEGVVTRGWLGIGIQNLDAGLGEALDVGSDEGAVVISVSDGSPADQAGLKVDDVVVGLNGRKIDSGDTLSRQVALERPGSTVRLRIVRDGTRRDLRVKLGTRPGGPADPGRSGTDPDAEKRRLGVSFQDVDPRWARANDLPGGGAQITEVVPGSPAERAGLAPGMIVVEAGGEQVGRASDFLSAVRAAKPGTPLLLRVQLLGQGGRRLVALRIPEGD